MKRFFCAILALLMLAALAGCSKSVSDEMLSYREESSNGFYSDMAGDYPESQEKPQKSGEAAVNKKLIRTIYLEAETEDLAGLLQAVQQQVDAMEGYVESRNVYHGNGSSNDYRYADLVLRIPAERADGFCAYVEGESNIISSNEDVDDVTLSYVATESRVKALQTEEARLLELMEQAETMSDLLEIEARLTDVRYELETVTSQLRLYDNLVDYATIQLNVRQVQVLTPMHKETIWQRMGGGFVESVQSVWIFLQNLLVGLVAGLPYYVLIGLFAWAVIWVISRIVRKRRKKKNTAAGGETGS